MSPRFPPAVRALDRRVGAWMHRFGHPIHTVTLAVFFIWLGLLKQFGFQTGSSLIASTVYFGSPELMVPILGWWEVAIGLTLLHPSTIRISIALMAVRLPGTFLALVLKAEVCFESFPLVPTPAGQYLIKDLMLFGAAMVIGSTVAHGRRSHGVDRVRESDHRGSSSAREDADDVAPDAAARHHE